MAVADVALALAGGPRAVEQHVVGRVILPAPVLLELGQAEARAADLAGEPVHEEQRFLAVLGDPQHAVDVQRADGQQQVDRPDLRAALTGLAGLGSVHGAFLSEEGMPRAGLLQAAPAPCRFDPVASSLPARLLSGSRAAAELSKNCCPLLTPTYYIKAVSKSSGVVKAFGKFSSFSSPASVDVLT